MMVTRRAPRMVRLLLDCLLAHCEEVISLQLMMRSPQSVCWLSDRATHCIAFELSVVGCVKIAARNCYLVYGICANGWFCIEKCVLQNMQSYLGKNSKENICQLRKFELSELYNEFPANLFRY